MSQSELCVTPFGSFELQRALADRTETLRAWDGADLLLLEHIAALNTQPDARVLIIGDNFGALTVALSPFDPWVFVESMVSEHAILKNRRRANVKRPLKQLSFTGDWDQLGQVDLIVWNIERTTDVVSQIASKLAPVSHRETVLLAAGMDKILPPKTGDILRQLGDVTTHPGRRKAHLFEVRVASTETRFRVVAEPSPTTVSIPEYDLSITSGAGVFSADHFDLGSRLLAAEVDRLSTAPSDAQPNDVIDLGCGNGVLGIVALRAMPNAHVHFVDESSRAVESARQNVLANLGEGALLRSTFTQSNVLADVDELSADLVLCNPPFHHSNAMSDEVAWQMFMQSYEVIRPGGELWVVGNRHLDYAAKLRRLFGEVVQQASHPKFVVLAALR